VTPPPGGVSAGEATPSTRPRAPLAPQRLRLLLITDPAVAARGAGVLEEYVRRGLSAGVTAVQLRDKDARTGTLLPLARRLRALCRAHGAPFFVNDRVDLALAAGADGVHLGEQDLPISVVRLIAPDLWIGASADTAASAEAAVRAGAHYIGCGAVWGTTSKADAGTPIGVGRVASVAAAVDVPVVAIGGITPARAPALVGTGAAGVAVIRALLDEGNPEAAARAFRRAFP
jgi:thiamine-phosphate pyrophosphorylase